MATPLAGPWTRSASTGSKKAPAGSVFTPATRTLRFASALGDTVTTTLASAQLSRIDKLLLDRDAVNPAESLRRRADRGFGIAVGDDVQRSYDLQLALLTAVNLSVRTFGGRCTVYASGDLAESRNLVPVALGMTLRAAIEELGGTIETAASVPGDRPYLLLGNADPIGRALRVTFDGWRLAVGPAADLARYPERSCCPLACVAAAAIGVEEIFAEFAEISITATRRIVILSLWRPDVGASDPAGLGEPLAEIPNQLAVFGLGHLGQAYLWAYVALRHSEPEKATIVMCDDELLEPPNLETGAIASRDWLDRLKSRMAMHWLEARRFQTRLIERRIDRNFQRGDRDPVIALSGFDDNHPRQWLAQACFAAVFDSGLGGEVANFDTISFRSWPNTRTAAELWPIETEEEIATRDARRKKIIQEGGYDTLEEDECGRLLLAGKSVAVPFVGGFAACIVLAELLKAINGGPTYEEIKLRLCAVGVSQLVASSSAERAVPIRGVATQRPRD